MHVQSTRVLVAGVGNIFLGDDGFGVEVVRRLRECQLPDDVRVEDFGIRSLHLAYEMLDHPDAVLVLVDAMARGEAPGTVSLIEAEHSSEWSANPGDAHGMTPDGVMALIRTLGGTPPRLVVVGCEPADCAEQIGLSPQVAAAVEPAIDLIVTFVHGRDRQETPACA